MNVDTRPFYRTAHVGLRFLEQRSGSGRRFGVEADARWKGFCGDLQTADRIDLLIRDADAQWVGALGARTVFVLDDVCEDDPFGPRWEPLEPVEAEELWRGELATAAPRTVGEALDRAAAAWGLKLSPVAVGVIAPADRLVVAGPSAVASVAAAFAEGADLDWAAQVTVVATAPAHRQLAGLGAALLNATRIGALWSAEAGSKVPGARLIVSPDAAEADRLQAEQLAGG